MDSVRESVNRGYDSDVDVGYCRHLSLGAFPLTGGYGRLVTDQRCGLLPRMDQQLPVGIWVKMERYIVGCHSI